MFANSNTVAFVGIEARTVDVQVHIGSGQQRFNIVGLADKAIAESRERVEGALHSIGLGLPPKRITVNLAPADLPKEGSHYDLPIALGLLAACGAFPADELKKYCVIGELSLDGGINHVIGGLPAAMGAVGLGLGLICPEECGAEAAWASHDLDIVAAPHILSIINHFKGLQVISRPSPKIISQNDNLPDLKDIRGQESAKRALEVAAAGGHNLLMIGPPGSGKSMLAQRLPSILPDLDPSEMLEVSMIQSMAGELSNGEIGCQRPFRAPHHSASMAALVGGGIKPKPGEVALAHLGVLFLDELPEFSPKVLDSLRQPLESGETVIARVNHRITYPSKIQLIAAMNPCRCGRAGEPGFTCRQGKKCKDAYQARISGPLLDRIDIQIEVPAVLARDLVLPKAQESSSDVKQRVINARNRQISRFKSLGIEGVRTNSDCGNHVLEKIVQINGCGQKLLEQAIKVYNLSARGYHRTLKLARTLADLSDSDIVSQDHLAEALGYRGEILTKSLVA